MSEPCCSGCGATGNFSILFPLAYGDILRCGLCDLAFLWPRSGDLDQYVQSVMSLLGERYSQSWVDFQRQSLVRVRAEARQHIRLIRRYKQSGTLLEIGPGIGEFLREARDSGYDVTGIDVTEGNVALITQTYPWLDVTIGTISDLAVKGVTFDIVVMSHVLEHISQPARYLHQLRSVLSEEGILYLVVPNLRSNGAMLLRAKWGGFCPDHLVHFTDATLARLLERNGFKVVATRTQGPSKDLGSALVLAAKEKLLGGNRGSSAAEQPGAAVSCWIKDTNDQKKRLRWLADVAGETTGWVLFPVNMLLNRLGMGSEVVLLARASR